MIKSISILFVFLIIICSNGQSQHSIEAEMNACLEMDENHTTRGMILCMENARKAWLGEIENHIVRLESILDSTQFSLLQVSQSSWETYHENQVAFLNDYYSKKSGSIWKTIAATQRLELARKRATELFYLLDSNIETSDK